MKCCEHCGRVIRTGEEVVKVTYGTIKDTNRIGIKTLMTDWFHWNCQVAIMRPPSKPQESD